MALDREAIRNRVRSIRRNASIIRDLLVAIDGPGLTENLAMNIAAIEAECRLLRIECEIEAISENAILSLDKPGRPGV